ncbi:MAG: hypothetical protein Q8O00_06960 [Holophaga sp.]|nr:hypothetical protein [Holophaga sp.]
MAKLTDTPIMQADITEFLNTRSDFGFEVKTLSKLCQLGFVCSHAGTYEDPTTGKARQFDIRATKDRLLAENLVFRLQLSVECKNLRPNFPLLIHCMPRLKIEAGQPWIWSFPAVYYGYYNMGGHTVYARPIYPSAGINLYSEGLPVGKATDQVGRRFGDGQLVENDVEVFDKVSQAVNSAYELVRRSCFASSSSSFPHVVSLVVPVLVVPDGHLWVVGYDDAGNVTSGPETAKSIEFYLGRHVEVDQGDSKLTYALTHLEIVQISELGNLIVKLLNENSVTVDAVRSLLAEDARVANQITFVNSASSGISPP